MQTRWSRIRNRLFHFFFLMRRPMTLGARIAVEDDAGRFLLVRHTYVPGWQFPGGGVNRAETAHECAVRELREETGIEADGEMAMVSIHANRKASPRDHVVFYHCRKWRRAVDFRPTAEIAEARFFAREELPETATESTRSRYSELAGDEKPSAYW